MTVQLTNIVNNARRGKPQRQHGSCPDHRHPTLVVYFLPGSYFVRGIAVGAVKG